MRIIVSDYDIITAYGTGIDAAWQGILSGKNAVKKITRFNADHFQSQSAALVDGLEYHGKNSLVWQMLEKILAGKKFSADTLLILATTTAEVDLLEQSMIADKDDGVKSLPRELLAKLQKKLKLKNGMVISCACVSSSAALGFAAAQIESKKYSSVVVVACDAVSEFVYAGFSSLMALDSEVARPFDKHRKGLSVGDAAGYMVLTGSVRAGKEKQKIQAQLLGYGLSNDANHMTGPARDGFGLSTAINRALSNAGVKYQKIGSICAHGTGTPYNDSMEMKAFKAVFKEKIVPAYSIKGALGHTMGAAGLVEAAVCIKALQEMTIPPTVNLSEADEEARGWVSHRQIICPSNTALSVNAGFGGVNSALVLKV